LAQSQSPENVASGECRIENAGYVCACNQTAINDKAFWERVNRLLISLVCEIEREKLHCTHTTSELRKIGREVLCKAGRT
jgi:hypothetical protein